MLQTIKSWPNATTAAICVVVMAIVFLFSIVTAPARHEAAAPANSSAVAAQPDDPVYKQPAASTRRPIPELPRDQLIDYPIVGP